MNKNPLPQHRRIVECFTKYFASKPARPSQVAIKFTCQQTQAGGKEPGSHICFCFGRWQAVEWCKYCTPNIALASSAPSDLPTVVRAGLYGPSKPYGAQSPKHKQQNAQSTRNSLLESRINATFSFAAMPEAFHEKRFFLSFESLVPCTHF